MKRVSLLAVILAVVAVLALGWWITRGDSRSTATAVALPAQVGIAADSSALAEAASVHETTTRSAAPTSVVFGLDHGRAKGPVVIVTDALSYAPVREAEVRWTDTPPVYRDAEHPLVEIDPESLFERAESGLRTDAEGRVTLPGTVTPVVVWARLGDRFGSNHLNRRQGSALVEENAPEIRITLERGIHLDIQVVDASKRPVSDVPVSIRNGDKSEFSMPIWTGITDSGGMAHARHLQRAIAGLDKPFRLIAGFEFPTRTARTLPVDIGSIPKTALRLVLPECGSVEVRARSASRSPLLVERVELSVSRPELESFALSMRLHSHCKPARVEPGRAFFPFVETGLELTAWLTYESRAFRRTGHGPVRSGDRVTLDVEVGLQPPQLAGRLVDSNHRPMADLEGASVLAGGNVSMQTAVRTDALGRFTVTVPCDAEQRFDGTLAFKQIKGHARDEAGLLELDRILHSGVNEIGDVVVRAPVVIAAIRVVDELERPVQGLHLGIEVERMRDGVPTWTHGWDLHADGTQNDSYEIKSVAPARRMRVQVTSDELMQIEPCVIERGSSNTRIVMVKATEFAGRILVDDDIDAKRIQIFVRGAEGASGAAETVVSSERTQAQSDGTFRLRPVRARLADLWVQWPDGKEPLVVLRDLDLRAGGRVKDPRLHEIDLRGRKLPTDRVR